MDEDPYRYLRAVTFFLISIVVIIAVAILFKTSQKPDNIPITVKTIVSAVFLVVLTDLFFSIVRSVVVLRRILTGFKYRFLPFPSDFNDYRNGLIKYYSNEADENAQRFIYDDLNNYYRNELLEACSLNINSNNEKMYLLNKAKRITLRCVIVLLTSIAPYVIIRVGT